MNTSMLNQSGEGGGCWTLVGHRQGSADYVDLTETRGGGGEGVVAETLETPYPQPGASTTGFVV